MTKENEVNSVNETPAEKSEAIKKESKKKEAPQTDGVILPVLVEFTFTVSVIILAILFTTVVGVSLLTGAKLLDIVIRTSATMLVVGGLLILISRQISVDVLNAARLQEEEVKKKLNESSALEHVKSKPARSTLEQVEEFQPKDEFEKHEEMDNNIPSEA